jgi:hypothetical protein
VDAADPLAPKPEEPVAAQVSDKGSTTNTAAATATGAAGGAAAASAAAPYSQRATEDRVVSSIEGQVSVVDIYRGIGRGGVQLQAPVGGWPEGVLVRLHGFRSLPNLHAAAANRAMDCKPAPTGQNRGAYGCNLDGATIDAAHVTKNYVQVSLPKAFLSAGNGGIELRWSESAAVANQ